MSFFAGAERSHSARGSATLPDSADRAYEALRSGTASQTFADGTHSTHLSVASRENAPASQAAEGPSAERLLDRARQAESNGKRKLALAYLRTARDLGLPEARHEIERISPTRK